MNFSIPVPLKGLAKQENVVAETTGSKQNVFRPGWLN